MSYLKKHIEDSRNKKYKYCLIQVIWYEESTRVFESKKKLAEQLSWLKVMNIDNPGKYIAMHYFELKRIGGEKIEKEKRKIKVINNGSND